MDEGSVEAFEDFLRSVGVEPHVAEDGTHYVERREVEDALGRMVGEHAARVLPAVARAVDHLPLRIVAELLADAGPVGVVSPRSLAFGPDVVLTDAGDDGAVLAVRIGDRIDAALYRDRVKVEHAHLPTSALRRGFG